jgi:nucleoside-diphosphate-sugar epimerase
VKEKGILITGLSGFVGQNFKRYSGIERLYSFSLQDGNLETIRWDGIDTVLHIAGYAHHPEEKAPEKYYSVNMDYTKALALMAKENGVEHFIFISTVKVYGEYNSGANVWQEDSECYPADDYAKSKYLAEKELLKMQSDNFIVSVIRPPLIYGYGVKGNLQSLLQLIKKLPVIPLGRIKNNRCMVNVRNLIDLLINLINDPVPGIFLLTDTNGYSTSDIVREMIEAAGARSKLVWIPFLGGLIRFLRPAMHQRLFRSIFVDDSRTRNMLNFKPKYTFADGVRDMLTTSTDRYELSDEKTE